MAAGAPSIAALFAQRVVVGVGDLGVSNNPAISIFNLGRPGIDKTAFSVGDGVKSLTIQMRYL